MITQQFARQFINNPSYRTPVNKEIIRREYRKTVGGYLNAGCSTCYIEALLKILNKRQMASNKYILKKGVVLQAFGDASKTVTSLTITDEIAAWYLKNWPEKIIYFDRVPSKVPEPVIEPVVEERRPVNEITRELVEVDANDDLGEAKPKRKRTPKKAK